MYITYTVSKYNIKYTRTTIRELHIATKHKGMNHAGVTSNFRRLCISKFLKVLD